MDASVTFNILYESIHYFMALVFVTDDDVLVHKMCVRLLSCSIYRFIVLINMNENLLMKNTTSMNKKTIFVCIFVVSLMMQGRVHVGCAHSKNI